MAFERGQSARRSEGLYGGHNGGFGVRSTALEHASHHGPVEGSLHLDDIAILHPFTVDQKAVSRYIRDGHLRHFSPGPPHRGAANSDYRLTRQNWCAFRDNIRWQC